MASTAFTDGVTLSQSTWAQDVDTATYNMLSAVAGTNTITATGPVGMTAYASGQTFRFIPAATNTSATTLNITTAASGALGAKNIFLNGAACVGGEIRQNVPVEMMYDGTQFNILGPYVGGNLPTGQVKFPATQNPSSDVNTLDDYEEGSWTPGIAFGGGTTGITYSVQTGRYTKIGNTVRAWFDVALSAKGSSTGTTTITGLPFTINASLAMNAPSILLFTSMTTSYVNLIAVPLESTATAQLMGLTAAATSWTVSIAETALSATSRFNGCLVYHI